LHCTASVRHVELNQHRIPERNDSVYSLEGTEAHDYCEQILNEEKTLEDIPEEFRDPVKVYLDECNRIQEENPELEAFIEEAVPLWYSEPKPPVDEFGVEIPDVPKSEWHQDTGTVDFAAVGEDKVFVRDLKYGAGVYVAVEGNSQQAIYAMSLVADLEKLGYYTFAPDTMVDIGIVQPRHHLGEPVRSWVLSLADLRDFCEDIENTVKDIHDGKVKFAPSDSACQWCDVRLFCNARNAELTKGMPEDPTGIDFLAALPTMDNRGDVPAHNKLPIEERIEVSFDREMTDEDLVQIYQRRKGLTTLLKDVEDYLTEKAMSGTPVEGTKLVMGREGNRVWADEAKGETFLANQHIAKADRTVAKLVSITQAEKLLGDKLNEKSPDYAPRTASRLKELTFRSPAQKVLAPESDKREAVDSGLESLPQLDDQPEDIA
jgi:hypothetical protein